MTDEPQRLVDRFFSVCITIFFAALAIWAAVSLIVSVWRVLTLIILIGFGVAGLIWWLRRNQSRW